MINELQLTFLSGICEFIKGINGTNHLNPWENPGGPGTGTGTGSDTSSDDPIYDYQLSGEEMYVYGSRLPPGFGYNASVDFESANIVPGTERNPPPPEHPVPKPEPEIPRDEGKGLRETCLGLFKKEIIKRRGRCSCVILAPSDKFDEQCHTINV